MNLKKYNTSIIKLNFALFFTCITFFATQTIANETKDNSELYEFTEKLDTLLMQDGTKLAVTYFMPTPKYDGEKFPPILELLPYRKDDLFYARDYPLYSYFAKRGFAMTKVDIRGTGSSEGKIPPREYSDIELNDAIDIIDQLSKKDWSNGNVGMWGISWGGFNAIQVAMKKPPALKAILAMCASDDLFYDDVHYIDGAYHVDQYEIRIDTKHGLPNSNNYKLDKKYFKERFNAYPWFLTYLKQQKDGDFWRKNSLRFDYSRLKTPTFLIGGLLDGYKDSIPRMLQNMKDVPMKALMGPWIHCWPDNGTPGPTYEWRHEVSRWWNYWLKGVDTGIMNEPRFTLFVRDSHLPDPNLEMTPGHWRYEEWPIKRTEWEKYYPGKNNMLLKEKGISGTNKLKYLPGYGFPAGYWWGEPTGDMRPADAGSLIYDSEIVEDKIEIIGFPKMNLQVSTTAKLANWIVRLEDVNPNGEVSLVTGGLINGSQIKSRLEPEYLVPNKKYNIEVPLHFTTWTFQPGHKIRIAVSNSMFPMIWPTPYSMTTSLYFGLNSTSLELPVIPYQQTETPKLLPSEARESRKDAKSLGSKGWPYLYRSIVDINIGKTTVEWKGESESEIKGNKFFFSDETLYHTNESDPANSGFHGETVRKIQLKDRNLQLKTIINLQSDVKNFNVKFTRQIYEDNKLIKSRDWEEVIPRIFH